MDEGTWHTCKNIKLATTLVDLDEKNNWVMDMVSTIQLEVYTSLDEQDYISRRSKQREEI